MDETLLLVKRREGCKCSVASDGSAVGDVAPTDMGQWIPCPHGTTAEILNARAVRCFDCAGRGSGVILATGGTGIETTYVAHPCAACLGTGLRLASMEVPDT